MSSTILRDAIRGRVLEPGDIDYDEARTVWNGMIDRRPRYIVQCLDADDVAEAVRFAANEHLDISVRCGGHGIVGHAVAHDGLMIDLQPMGAVTVDPAGRRARVQGGALLGELDRAAQRFGLATTAGNVSHTGVGGLTLGGGMGWLARQYGLACDNVVSFEVVVASGERLRADADSHPELFWALRGGGGNFGVVTEFEFALHPQPGHVVVVELQYPLAEAGPPMRLWRDLSRSAPREATYTATIGGATVNLGFVWVGEPGEGSALAAIFDDALTAVGSPERRSVEPMSYLQLQSREDEVKGHAWRRYWKGHYFNELSDQLIDTLLARDADGLPDVSLQAYGGAIADAADGESAFSRRDAAFEFVAASRWRDPTDDELRMNAARAYAATMDGFASGAYVNVLGDDGEHGLRRAYPEAKLARLTEVKTTYDPENVFHLNQNIRPAAS
ncbi:FAD-binding oxidoreductase [Agromyces subbeticus]|uniref:FAD-binding oxidoreductase n=1 Tax=Agromyces subbeticus TaxID=293890 RepID=UPI0003B7B375|nr:FAD-binding oxidoreductase [Agromyces subbeticus]